ncbi:monocarboxylate transporter 9-like [Fopius arisanus]|uniref:Monocarboxylate transporter 9-like n=1 Tax=Fopius arisanus TaxID=64838 RepID=A0A9R1TYJ7_9HYME|nr:PREDICTED: monocarboxylate transporter 9-like [Fopius arisanus]XP_011301365.1 PREDICTED: monocarboxylate transporter 9-like [Fopius arisanus]
MEAEWIDTVHRDNNEIIKGNDRDKKIPEILTVLNGKRSHHSIMLENKEKTNLAYEDEASEDVAFVKYRTRNNEQSGSDIRKEAREAITKDRQEAQQRNERNDNIKRPGSLYTRNLSVDDKDGNESVLNETSIVGNGNKCLRVKFNASRTKRSSKPKDDGHPSPSISTASSSPSAEGSSEDNSSLGQFSEARPTDGGWGWVVVAASFMVNLIADGITFSFGVIYVEFLNYFGEGKSKTAWIGSLFMAMPLLSGPVASFLTDRYGCRRVSIAGSILATLGFVISSYTSSMAVLIFTFGVISGFGLSLCFVAAVVIVAYYFDKRRSFATGLSVCGSGIGTFIFAPLTQYLLAEYGWRGTTLILAGFFFNLAVCGCLMRDLEWTTIRAKAKCQERKRNRERKRTSRIQSSSADSFSASSSANTTTHTPGVASFSAASANPIILENSRRHVEEHGKNFSSLLTLPTFLKNGDQVPIEVLELLATRKDVYNILLHNYPSLLTSSRSFSDSATINDGVNLPVVCDDELTKAKDREEFDNLDRKSKVNSEKFKETNDDAAVYLWWLRKLQPDDCQLQRSSTLEAHRRLPTAYLRNIRMHRHSLTYRGAMLNINRYRLRASSCPDIYRNSMTTIAKTKLVWYSGVWEFWDLVVDMLDFSHFADSRFLLFSISNFLLHTWYDVPYVYLTDNAIEMGFSETDASMLISVIGITNMLGEIFLGWAGDKVWVNASIVYAVCMILCGAVTSIIPLVVRHYYALCAVSGAFGIFIAANYSLTSIILVEVITLERFTNAYGLLLLVQGIANLMGPPLAGLLYDITGTYDLSFYLAGFFIGLSGILLMVVPCIEMYRKYSRKNNANLSRKNLAAGINSV